MSRRHIHILMCTFNGASFLPAQLKSFLDQDHNDWSLWVRDDGSTDGTLELLEAFRLDNPDREIEVLIGDQKGVAMNFLSLICEERLRGRDGYIALSDQDDVWLPHRLSRGLKKLETYENKDPALYGGRVILVDEDLRQLGLSHLFSRPPTFANALVQNIVGGNTMLLNRLAWDLVRQAGPQPSAPFHDWWIYQLMSGSGAYICVDRKPSLLYRQHGANALGTNTGRAGIRHRLSMLRNQRFKCWVAGNSKALNQASALLTPDSRRTLKLFEQRHSRWRLPTAFLLLRRGIRRQSIKQTFVLYSAYLAGRF